MGYPQVLVRKKFYVWKFLAKRFVGKVIVGKMIFGKVYLSAKRRRQSDLSAKWLSAKCTGPDCNNDTFLDIIVANYYGSNQGIFLGQNDGTFDQFFVVATNYGFHPILVSSDDFNKDEKNGFCSSQWRNWQFKYFCTNILILYLYKMIFSVLLYNLYNFSMNIIH